MHFRPGSVILVSIVQVLHFADSATEPLTLAQQHLAPPGARAIETARSTRTAAGVSSSVFLDLKQPGSTGLPNTGDTRADCAYQATLQRYNHYKYTYTFFTATCDDTDPDRRIYHVTCKSTYTRPPYYDETFPGKRDQTSRQHCPIGQYCQASITFGFVFGLDHDIYDIVCIKKDQVRIEQVSPSETHSQQQQPNPGVYCGDPLQLPDPDLHQDVPKELTILLTESIWWKNNGTPYEAPALYIHDTTTRHGLDRTYRVDASVASAEVTLRATRGGRIEPRIFEFCAKLGSDASRNAVLVFTYSYLVLAHPRRARRGGGVIPAVLDTDIRNTPGVEEDQSLQLL